MTSPTLPSPNSSPVVAAGEALRPLRGRDVLVPAVLFVITMLSTTAVGMRYMYNFRRGMPPISADDDVLPYAWVFHHWAGFADGLPFSLTLVTILLAHEFGHYFACRLYGVRSTLPYMLPAPSLSGTFGAVIRLKSRVKSRAALIVIGAAGPIAGFVVAIFAVMLGLMCSYYRSSPTVGQIQAPLLIQGIHALLAVASPSQAHPLSLLVPHPILIASWIGLLITALNLIPAGQLDGGHILYAVSPTAHHTVSRVATCALFVMAFFFWGGWLLWALLLLLPGMRHPKIASREGMVTWHFMLAPLCAVVLLLTATLQPFEGYSLLSVVQRFAAHR